MKEPKAPEKTFIRPRKFDLEYAAEVTRSSRHGYGFTETCYKLDSIIAYAKNNNLDLERLSLVKEEEFIYDEYSCQLYFEYSEELPNKNYDKQYEKYCEKLKKFQTRQNKSKKK